ncbi:hypothetical protein CYMTET_36400 [Cymbomonas tetramitiformis]|uniref:Uncharacterized protein n=1 Tax=Cymbomonas tetramitiformis TaxID=36881 RepID=A0AAE0CI96_9CHLO|nr:hypothetical protein CYMTET_36400 [Cymbomonas tetramitiformis]
MRHGREQGRGQGGGGWHRPGGNEERQCGRHGEEPDGAWWHPARERRGAAAEAGTGEEPRGWQPRQPAHEGRRGSARDARGRNRGVAATAAPRRRRGEGAGLSRGRAAAGRHPAGEAAMEVDVVAPPWRSDGEGRGRRREEAVRGGRGGGGRGEAERRGSEVGVDVLGRRGTGSIRDSAMVPSGTPAGPVIDYRLLNRA